MASSNDGWDNGIIRRLLGQWHHPTMDMIMASSDDIHRDRQPTIVHGNERNIIVVYSKWHKQQQRRFDERHNEYQQMHALEIEIKYSIAQFVI